MNVLSRWRASGAILGSVCAHSTTNSATRSGIVLLQHPVLHQTLLYVSQKVELTATMSSFPLWVIIYFKPRDLFDAQRRCSWPSSPSAQSGRYSSSLGSNPIANRSYSHPDASGRRHTFGFCLWLRQWNERFTC